MKVICHLTDREILGTEGLSSKKPRITARAIVRNTEGHFAVMYSEAFDLYSLPGGGVERGEDILTALHREIFEETGCIPDTVTPLGTVIENRASCDFTQENHYFLVTTSSTSPQAHFTPEEELRGTKVLFLPFTEMYERIAAPKHSTTQRKFIQARDLAAIEAYRKQENA
ncbi:MAG: NUDIX domain-containing protein [Ruminococcaceae bacterium]|nr:NUDIX domain-containing protein [Oscillospiraceae bacterium]